MGMFFYMDVIDSPALEKIMWLPVASLIVYVATYSCGFGPLPWAILGEMFPINVKSYAGTISACFCWGTSFILVKYFEAVSDALGIHWSFWIFTICGVAAFLFVYTILFETKGMSLQAIQDRLNGRRSSSS